MVFLSPTHYKHSFVYTVSVVLPSHTVVVRLAGPIVINRAQKNVFRELTEFVYDVFLCFEKKKKQYFHNNRPSVCGSCFLIVS